MRVFFFAGEASGDAYAAAIVRELRKLRDDWDFEAVGGKALAAENVILVEDSTTWGSIGIIESLKVAPKVYWGARHAVNVMKQGGDGVFVAIDFGAANIRIARHMKKHGWKVLYFVPPGCWRRHRQGKDLPIITDEIVTPFPWSAEILNRMGASAHFFGHPMKDLVSAEEIERGEGVALLPGSRRSEIQHNLEVMAKAVEGLPLGEFAVAPTVDLDELKKRWKRLTGGRGDVFTVGDVDGVLRRARAAIVCSGTATLQAAIAQTPMVVIYRFGTMNMIQGRIMKAMRDFGFISLPNIIADRQIVPELIQDGATPEAIRRHLLPLLEFSEERVVQLKGLHEVNELLGEPGCIQKTAELILRMSAMPKS